MEFIEYVYLIILGVIGLFAWTISNKLLTNTNKNKLKRVSKTSQENNYESMKQSYDDTLQIYQQNLEVAKKENLHLNRANAKLKGLSDKKDNDDDEEEFEDLTAEDILDKYDIDFNMAGTLAKNIKLPFNITPELFQNPAMQKIAMGYLSDNPEYLEMAIKAGVLKEKGTLIESSTNQSQLQSPSNQPPLSDTATQLRSGSA